MKGNRLHWLRQEEVFQPAGVRLSLWTWRLTEEMSTFSQLRALAKQETSGRRQNLK